MIKIPNYNVVVPTTPDLTLYTKPRAATPDFYNTGSVHFDDTLSGLSGTLGLSSNSAFAYYTNPFTIECWCMQTAITIRNIEKISVIYSQANPDSGNGKPTVGNYLIAVITNGVPGFRYRDNGSEYKITGNTPIQLNQWTHLAWVREGTGTNQFKIYVNGVVIATSTVPTNFNYTMFSPRIAGYISDHKYRFVGYISNFRIVSGTAVYTANFTPPALPLTAINGTILLTCQYWNSVVDNSINKFTVYFTGNIKVVLSTNTPFNKNAFSLADGERRHLEYTTTVTNALVIDLPWMPTAPDWVEIYLDGIRVVNPRIKSITGGNLFEVFNVTNKTITFNSPLTGKLQIICDTKATHYWGSLILNARNVQGFYVYTQVHNFEILKWNVTAGTVNGLTFNVFYEPGPEFQANSYVIIENCVPTAFNGNFKVIQSTPESVTFRGETTLEVLTDDPVPLTANRVWYNTTSKLYKQSKLNKQTNAIDVITYTTKAQLAAAVTLIESPPSKSYITKPGIISGFGNATVTKLQGISLYSEPIIITHPTHGYARLTADRQSIAYVPNANFKGFDTFSWSMINQHGQIGTPKCVQINIRDF